MYPIGHNTGDGDKLMRAALDALTGVVYKDDSQVARWSGSKTYSTEPEGVWISVSPI
jgi:Holliday junction resolvase RusA-like endonuclease